MAGHRVVRAAAPGLGAQAMPERVAADRFSAAAQAMREPAGAERFSAAGQAATHRPAATPIKTRVMHPTCSAAETLVKGTTIAATQAPVATTGTAPPTLPVAATMPATPMTGLAQQMRLMTSEPAPTTAERTEAIVQPAQIEPEGRTIVMKPARLTMVTSRALAQKGIPLVPTATVAPDVAAMRMMRLPPAVMPTAT